MPIKRVMKGIPLEDLTVEGILENNTDLLTPYQQECLTRFGMTCRMEQEAYLIMHPEIRTMMTSFVKKMVGITKRKEVLKEAAEYFTRPREVIDNEIQEKLNVSTDEPYLQINKKVFCYDDQDFKNDLKTLKIKHFPSDYLHNSVSNDNISDTISSSFISLITSDTTLPTPEPVPTPEPTLSENMFTIILNTVDKAIFLHVNDEELRYDTAYVELSKAVEEAMEVPVIDIRQDISELFHEAFRLFEADIIAKEKIAAEKAWEKRMRKKLKRTLRRMNNFKVLKGPSGRFKTFCGILLHKRILRPMRDLFTFFRRNLGYETPPTPKSELSSHESYKISPPRPCICHPQYTYNRYPKDRFGIYLPRKSVKYNEFNVTITPAISLESFNNEVAYDKIDKKSIISKKSFSSTKSATNKKCAFYNSNE